MRSLTPDDIVRLEAAAAKAKAVARVKDARVRRAVQAQQAAKDQAIFALVRELGLLAYPVEALRGPLTLLADNLRPGIKDVDGL